MGRMWNVLRRSDSTAAAPVEDAEAMPAPTEELPFIEVGPGKSMEASPSVLACSANGADPSLALRAREKPAPRRVPFRAVFLATQETEPETPQSDSVIPS